MLALGTFACDNHNDLDNELTDDVDFCLCLNLEDVNKTIPIVNEYLAGLPEDVTVEQTFDSLVTWFNSFPCDVNAQILYGKDMISGQEYKSGVSISVADNGTVRELELDFAVVEQNGNYMKIYSQIAGYVYYKQDAIYVKTNFITINEVFGFINSLELNVREIQYGAYLSSMAANADTMQYVVDNLKAKPYTTDAWVTGQLNWYNANFVIFINLYDMKNADYQADWLQTMNEYQFVVKNPGDLIVFFIPEGTGAQWKTNFAEYSFVKWTELTYTRYTIR